MPDKKLTDSEIVKALNTALGMEHISIYCANIKNEVYTIKVLDIIDLINRLQAKLDEAEDTIQFADKELKKANTENERLHNLNNEILDKYDKCIDKYDNIVQKQSAEIERLKKRIQTSRLGKRFFEADNKRLYEIIENKNIKTECFGVPFFYISKCKKSKNHPKITLFHPKITLKIYLQ